MFAIVVYSAYLGGNLSTEGDARAFVWSLLLVLFLHSKIGFGEMRLDVTGLRGIKKCRSLCLSKTWMSFKWVACYKKDQIYISEVEIIWVLVRLRITQGLAVPPCLSWVIARARWEVKGPIRKSRALETERLAVDWGLKLPTSLLSFA